MIRVTKDNVDLLSKAGVYKTKFTLVQQNEVSIPELKSTDDAVDSIRQKNYHSPNISYSILLYRFTLNYKCPFTFHFHLLRTTEWWRIYKFVLLFPAIAIIIKFFTPCNHNFIDPGWWKKNLHLQPSIKPSRHDVAIKITKSPYQDFQYTRIWAKLQQIVTHLLIFHFVSSKWKECINADFTHSKATSVNIWKLNVLKCKQNRHHAGGGSSGPVLD